MVKIVGVYVNNGAVCKKRLAVLDKYSFLFSKGDSDKIQNNLHSGVWNVVKQLENEQNTNEVILIKLAERLHNMRTIEYIDESKRTEKIKETMEIYMPLARKINNQKLMDELNNLVFS